jgi:starch-binding outer membrane protein, SusD/RagB family
MIMRKILLFVLSIALLAGCSDDFLDTQNLTQKNSQNFPANADEANQALTGIYSLLPSFGAMSHIVMLSELRSDDRFGGGGQNDRDPQAIDVFRVTNTNLHKSAWTTYYKGIFRCNTLLAGLNNAKWTSSAEKAQVFGETSFMRAYYYFDLVRLFGQVPLRTKPTNEAKGKATPEELYAQIALDLKNAIDSLPATKYPMAKKDLGRATKWAAQGLMARVFLFYTGYYQKQSLPLPDGTEITKANVVAWVDQLIAESGHSLLPDFRNQWSYAISNKEKEYAYANTHGLKWADEQGGNSEAIFWINYAPAASTTWGEQVYYSNQLNVYSGLRTMNLMPFGQGWGFLPVNTRFFDEWPAGDIRKSGSILNVKDASEGIVDSYKFGGDMQWQETGFWGKKYIPINVLDAAGKIKNYSVVKYGAPDNMQLFNTQNIVMLRLADVMLMAAELGSANAQKYLDDVRTRAGLASVSATQENIRAERRYELAFEGLRYFDLLRWYGKEAGVEIKKNSLGAKIFNMGVETTIENDKSAYFNMIDQRVRDTGGFLMIPADEVSLSEGALEQNPGWTNSADYMF